MSGNPRQPASAIVEYLRSDDNATDAFADLAELGVDEILPQLEAVPVLGSVLKVTRAGMALRDYVLARKLIALLKEATSRPREERTAFMDGVEKRAAAWAPQASASSKPWTGRGPWTTLPPWACCTPTAFVQVPATSSLRE